MAVSKISGHLPGLLHYRYAGCVHNCSRTLSRHSPRSGQPATSPSPDISDIGTESLSSVIDPLQHEDFFGVNKLVNMKHLFDSGVHLGHKSGTRNVHMRPYLFGTRLGVDILDLNHTLPLLKEAMNFTAHIAYREGIIMFISRNKQTFPIVERAATDCGEYSHCRRWQLGTFTNATKEFGSITRLPDLCIFISTHDSVFEQHLGVVEAAKCNIPTIAILDTSCDGKLITYPVPGNDDSPSAVQLYCNLFKEAVLLGKNKRKEMQQIKEEQ